MASTRRRDDLYQRKLQAEASAALGKYQLNVPGPGTNLPFWEDPHIRLQKWGANMMTHTIAVEDDLLGKTKPINYRAGDLKTYQETAVETRPLSFPTMQPFVEETRASHPAWMYKDLAQSNWSFPLLNPQYAPGEYMPGTFGLGRGIVENVSTRILERDYNKGTIPVVDGVTFT
jgi:hypothetical protein